MTSTLSSPRYRAVIGMVLFIMLGFGLIIPVLPKFAESFHVKEGGVGLLLSVFAAMRLVGDLVAGSLIDRFGERTLAAIGAAIVGLSSVAAGSAHSFAQLVIFRGAGGVGSAFFLGALTAYLIGTADESDRGRAISIYQGAIGIGITLGPLFGGLLGAISLRLPLYVYGAVCLATAPVSVMVMSGRQVPASALGEAGAVDQGPPAPRAPAWRRLRPLLKDSAYRAALMGSASDFWVSSALFTLIALLWVNKLGLSQRSAGIPLTVLGLAAATVIFHAGSISDRRGRKYALVPALLVTGLTLAFTGFATKPWMVVVLMIFLGFANGYSRPGSTSMVADIASDEQRAIAVSGYRTAGDIGALVSPIVAGVVAQAFGYRAAFLAISAFVFLAFLAAVRARETLPRRGDMASSPSGDAART